MFPSSFPRSVDSPGSSRMKLTSGSTPVPQTFMPFGRYADVGARKIKCSRPGLRLHVGSASTLYLSKGTLLGKDITYISQVWNAWDPESAQMFYEQVLPYIHPQTLRPLMGVCAPTVIGIHSIAAGGFSLAMELPHPIGWRPADPYISLELKEKVIVAFQSIHGRNILHNDVKLENILIGDDDEVTIVDFCKTVVDPVPADLALEMRAVKFMLDYEGAKEMEYEKLRRAESRVGKDFRRSWLRQAAERLGLADGAECEEPPSRDEVDFPPFSRQCLMKWDSEVVTEGTTHCPGWRGERFEVPEDMRSPSWPGIEEHTPLGTPTYQQLNSMTAFDHNPFDSRNQGMEQCHYFSSLWLSPPESAESGLKETFGSSSSSSTPTDLSDYATVSERSSASETEPSEKRRPDTPSYVRKRLRTEDLTRPDDYSYEIKRARRAKSLEHIAKYEGQISWATYRTEGLWPSPKPKGKERAPSHLVASPRGTSPPESDLLTLSSLSPDPNKSAAGGKRSTTGSPRGRTLAFADPHRSSPSIRRTLAIDPPQGSRPKDEKRYSVVVVDGDEEEKVWYMSREALQDVKGYLQVKKATGAAMEMRVEKDIRHSHPRAERVPCPSSTWPTRKRTSTPEDSKEEPRKPKRRRSWPEVEPYVSKPPAGSLFCSS